MGRPRLINHEEVYEMYLAFMKDNPFETMLKVVKAMEPHFDCTYVHLMKIIRDKKEERGDLKIPVQFQHLFE